VTLDSIIWAVRQCQSVILPIGSSDVLVLIRADCHNSLQTSPLLLPIGSMVSIHRPSRWGEWFLPLEGNSFTSVFGLLQLYHPADA
jgi:hypothetical protein